MLHTTNWDMTFAPGGWVRVRSTDGGPIAYLQFRLSGEGANSRFLVHATLMSDDEPIGARTWRRVPFDWVEDLANKSPWRGVLLKEPLARAPSMADVESYFDSEAALHIRNAINHEGDESYEPGPLSRPTGRITDDFLRDFAVAYEALTRRKVAPAPVLAEQTGAPVRTVHGWVAAARARGFLPPARKGRAG